MGLFIPLYAVLNTPSDPPSIYLSVDFHTSDDANLRAESFVFDLRDSPTYN